MSIQRPSGDRSLTWWPIAGAAVIAAIGVAAIIIVGSGGNSRTGLLTDDNGALQCPGTLLQNPLNTSVVPQASVPIAPTGVDGSKTLTPDSTPQQVTICHYAAAATLAEAHPALLGRVTLTKGLKDMAKALSKYPQAPASSGPCTEPADTYSVGFVFNGGADWVTVPGNGCQNVTNGDINVAADIRPQVIQAYRTRHWG